MARRGFILLLLGLMLVLGLAGCMGNNSNKVQTVENDNQNVVNLTFFGNKADESNVHVIEKIMGDFMKEHPNIIISYESIKGTDYYDALNKRMETGKADDIFMVDHDSTIRFQKEGKLAELTGLSTIPQYTEDMQEQFAHTDGIYWLPTTVSAFGLYCNMDMLEKHHQKVPTNWQEFVAVCDYFVAQGITPVVANNDISLKTVVIGASYYDKYQDGTAGEYFADINSGKIGFDESLAMGISLVDEMVQRQYVDAAAARDMKKTSEDLAAFAKGENPFMLTGVWASNRLKGDYHAEFNYEVYPLPILADTSLVVVNPDTRLAVNANSRHLAEAKLFVEYFTQAKNLHEFCEDQCSISPLREGESADAKEIQPVIKAYRDGRTVIGTDYRLNMPIWDMTKDAVRDLLKGTAKADVLDELYAGAKGYLMTNN